ncbi:MAG: hypothetical protein WC404_05670 [Candidatus Omnitrophota bacterium]|jgi:hypothetical protein
MKSKYLFTILAVFISITLVSAPAFSQTDDSTRNILKNGLLGAGTGAIAAGASGGKAGQGALIGAGTNVIGGALLDMITTPSAPARRSAPPQYDDQYYPDDQGDYYYEEPPQESGTQKILKQGLVGAGSGALASGMSGGDAGKGALIGAGTNIIGGALLDAITTPSQPRRVYRRPPPQQAPQQKQQLYTTTTSSSDEELGAPGTRKKVIRKYDESGKVVSEEETYY